MLPPWAGNISCDFSKALIVGFPSGVQTNCSFSKLYDTVRPVATKMYQIMEMQKHLQECMTTI